MQASEKYLPVSTLIFSVLSASYLLGTSTKLMNLALFVQICGDKLPNNKRETIQRQIHPVPRHHCLHRKVMQVDETGCLSLRLLLKY